MLDYTLNHLNQLLPLLWSLLLLIAMRGNPLKVVQLLMQPFALTLGLIIPKYRAAILRGDMAGVDARMMENGKFRGFEPKPLRYAMLATIPSYGLVFLQIYGENWLLAAAFPSMVFTSIYALTMKGQ